MSGFVDDDLHVDDDIRRAEGLPARAFTDVHFLNRELETIFERAWLAVPDAAGPARGATGDDARPLIQQVASRGSRVPIAQLGRPLFLQRGWDDDVLRCFANTCTHAWFPLVLGASRGPTLVCGQHGRRFDCAGTFVSQPGFPTGEKGLPDFPRDCDHLARLDVEAWRGLVFTRFAAGGPAFTDTFAPIDESLARMPATDAGASAAPGEIRDVAGNWKQHAANYLDRFHIAFIHRAPGGLADHCDLGTYTTEIHADSVLQWVYASDAASGFDPAQLPDRFHDPKGRRVFALWWFVWPNLTLNFYPWGLSINVYQPIAGRPDATRFLWYHHVLDAAKYAERDRRWLSAQVDAEDIDALAQVSRGLRSGLAPRGRFAPVEEQAAHWFHRRVSREVTRAGA